MLKCVQTDFFNFHCEEKRELSARQLFFQLYFIKKTQPVITEASWHINLFH